MKKILMILVLFASLSIIGQGDCPPTPVCANVTGVATKGIINELNNTNQGCLFGEATKTSWLSICFTSNGVFKFALTPGGGINNDMDWAMWGPNSVCPPITNPIRCSYAAVPLGGPKITGINSANNSPQTDLSEGASGNQWVQNLNVLANQCYVICISNYGNGNDNWSLNFNGTTANMLCSALPIELVSFSVEQKYCNQNILTWGTATEINNDHFEVERSLDAISFKTIKEIPGAINSLETKKYVYVDSNPEPGINYYRLKQVDLDGNYTYAPIVDVDNSCIRDLKVIKITNLLGQEVTEDYGAPKFIYYNDGSVIKKVGQ